MPNPLSAALPISWIALRILIVVNWVSCICVLALLSYTFIDEPWTMRALGVAGYSDAVRVMWCMRAVAALAVLATPFNYLIMRRVLAMIETVRTGNPFIAANAYRLHAIAWLMIVLQFISMAIGGIGKAISTTEHPFHLNAGFSVLSWVAILLTFVLARVFAEGTLMREDLDGTI